jgi:hypothetical protein
MNETADMIRSTLYWRKRQVFNIARFGFQHLPLMALVVAEQKWRYLEYDTCNLYIYTALLVFVQTAHLFWDLLLKEFRMLYPDLRFRLYV